MLKHQKFYTKDFGIFAFLNQPLNSYCEWGCHTAPYESAIRQCKLLINLLRQASKEG